MRSISGVPIYAHLRGRPLALPQKTHVPIPSRLLHERGCQGKDCRAGLDISDEALSKDLCSAPIHSAGLASLFGPHSMWRATTTLCSVPLVSPINEVFGSSLLMPIHSLISPTNRSRLPATTSRSSSVRLPNFCFTNPWVNSSLLVFAVISLILHSSGRTDGIRV
jgi:hypothetical protein